MAAAPKKKTRDQAKNPPFGKAVKGGKKKYPPKEKPTKK